MALLAAALGAPSAHAAIALTPAGQALGLTISTFASGFPNDQNVGPLGVAFTNTGGVLVTDKLGNIRLFPTDTDGQLAVAAPVTFNYGYEPSTGRNGATGLAQVGSNIYMTRQLQGDVVQLNQNGTVNQTIVTGLPFVTGIVANPASGHLFVSTIGVDQVYEINPITKTKTLFVNGDVDGLVMSADGSTLYLVGEDGNITGYNTTTKAVVFNPLFVNTFIDGATLGTGTLAGNLFINGRDGNITQVNLASRSETVIASGGSRGDFAITDGTNNTLLFTQTDSIIRLIPGGGGVIATPLPAGVWAGAFTALGGLFISRRAGAKRARPTVK
jgi:hypothetical protein